MPLVKNVMNPLVPYNAGNFWTTWGNVSFSRRTQSLKIITRHCSICTAVASVVADDMR